MLLMNYLLIFFFKLIYFPRAVVKKYPPCNLDPRALFPSDTAQSVCEGKKPWERG